MKTTNNPSFVFPHFLLFSVFGNFGELFFAHDAMSLHALAVCTFSILEFLARQSPNSFHGFRSLLILFRLLLLVHDSVVKAAVKAARTTTILKQLHTRSPRKLDGGFGRSTALHSANKQNVSRTNQSCEP
jgi:hypothetical protein